jgi:hypothetical protein
MGVSFVECLSLLKEFRKYSTGAWSTFQGQSLGSTSLDADSFFMRLYEGWNMAQSPIHSTSSVVVSTATLQRFDLPHGAGMYFDTGCESLQDADMIGFLPRRCDFDLEYDDSAELILADLELLDDEPLEDVTTKLECLRLYTARVKAREVVKAFAVREGLTDYQSQFDSIRCRTAEETDLRGKLRCLQRFFQSKRDFEDFVQLLLNEQRVKERLIAMHPNKIDSPASDTIPTAIAHSEYRESDFPHVATRSKTSTESKRSVRATEDDCARIKDFISQQPASIVGNDTMSGREIQHCLDFGIPTEFFPILRDSLLNTAQHADSESVEIAMRKFGKSISLVVRN